jgi:hypothetical protein
VEPGKPRGEGHASGDFDRDGRADLAIGVQRDDVGGVRAGAVNILYGSRRGLTATGDQRWSQANLPGVPERSDHFGGDLAAGDFNGDGYWDLAIGVEGDDWVQVLYGSADGLRKARTTTLAARQARINRTPVRRLAAGDLDGDGRSDLAVGNADASGNGVTVFYGSLDGLTNGRSEVWTQDSPGILGEAESYDGFGAAVSIGDFNADGFGDLAAGVPYEMASTCRGGNVCTHGAAAVIYGSAAGLTATGNQLWDEGSPGVPGTPDDGEQFGHALAAGDFNGDGADDLAIAAIGDNETGNEDGAVAVLYGGPSGLSASGAQLWTRKSAGMPRAAHWGHLGVSLASATYGRSTREDLAIGAPEVVCVLYGRTTGLTTRYAQAWSQDSPGVKGTTEDDHFGSTLTP